MGAGLEDTALFESVLLEAGLDAVVPFQVAWFNASASQPEQLPDFGRPLALGFIVGNSRRLWPRFRSALAADARLREVADPLDAYVERTLARAVSCLPVAAVTLFAHTLRPRPIPIQRVAEAAGLARIAPSHLSIHPTLGPWFALRAVVVLDRDGSLFRRPRPVDHCAGCAKPCLAPFERARELLELGSVGGARDEAVWRAFLAVREACPVGSSQRYYADQVDYHYSKRLDRLLATLEESANDDA